MKRKAIFILVSFLACLMSLQAFAANGPKDPAGKGKGILGFGLGPGIGYYGGNGFGPAFLVHYDHSIWQAGPGTTSDGHTRKGMSRINADQCVGCEVCAQVCKFHAIVPGGAA